jgi:hypothetical protein
MEPEPSLFDTLTGGQPIKGEVTVKIDYTSIAVIAVVLFAVVVAANAIGKRL